MSCQRCLASHLNVPPGIATATSDQFWSPSRRLAHRSSAPAFFKAVYRCPATTPTTTSCSDRREAWYSYTSGIILEVICSHTQHKVTNPIQIHTTREVE